MRAGLIAKKLGMSAVYADNGERQPVTLLLVDACQVIGHRTTDKDGYSALIIGAKNTKPSKVSKSVKQVFVKAKIEPKAHVKEFRIIDGNFLDIGTSLTVQHFATGQFVDVVGITIGKGFAGGMKRHNFRGLEASHGVSISHRSHGSTGGRQDPGRVFKNKKMAGHMGCKRSTVQNLRVVSIDEELQILAVSGNIPGAKGAYVYIKDAIKKSVTTN